MPRLPPTFRAPGWAPALKNRQAQDLYYGTAAWRRLRQAALQRDGFRCVAEDCSDPSRGHGRRLVCDHIVPRREGGADALVNLRTLCSSCDNRRHGRRGGGSGSQITKPLGGR